MITAAQMRSLEEQCERTGISQLHLMEKAGEGMARELIKKYGRVSYVIVCGQGNNGGDGFVCARYLHHFGVKAAVWFCGNSTKLPAPAKQNYNRLAKHLFVKDFVASEVIVDCLVGTGIHGHIREPARSAILRINQSLGVIVSCDVPSGMNPDTGDVEDIAVNSSHVLCMHDLKAGIDTHKYKTTVIDIGIPWHR